MKKITVTFAKSRASIGRKAWMVTTPARFSHTGKQSRTYHATKADAQRESDALNALITSTGCAIAQLSPANLADASLALNLLDGHPISLSTAAQFILQAIAIHGNISQAANHLLEGCGENNTLSGHPSSPLPPYSLSSAFADMGAEKDQYQSIPTIKTRASVINALHRRAPEYMALDINAINSTNTRETLTRICATPTSWKTFCVQLKAVMSWCYAHDKTKINTIAHIPLPVIKQKEIHAVTPKEMRNLLAACRPATRAELKTASTQHNKLKTYTIRDFTRYKIYIAILGFAGIRPREASLLKWQDIDLQEGVISIRSTTSKTGGARHVNIMPNLAQFIKAQKPKRVDPKSPIITKFNALDLCAIRKRAGYNKTNPWTNDALRHTYASMALKVGHDLETVRQNLGHSSTTLLRSTYLNMEGITKKSALDYFNITP